jgi:hypothetical protein
MLIGFSILLIPSGRLKGPHPDHVKLNRVGRGRVFWRRKKGLHAELLQVKLGRMRLHGCVRVWVRPSEMHGPRPHFAYFDP